MATFPNTTISGIKAPLTVDDSDSEYSVSSPSSRRNSIASSYHSNSELETEGFEDEYETRPYVSGQGEYGFYEPSVVEIVQENEFSRLSVRNPGEDFAPESVTVDGNSFFSPFARSPDEDFTRKSGDVDRNSILSPLVGIACKVISKVNDSDDSRSFLGDSGDELVESEENSENGSSPIADIAKIPVAQKLHIPIAKISRESDGDDDDDDGSQVSEVVESEGFLSIARVPSYGVLSRINSAPKVRISEADDDLSQAEDEDEDKLEMEFVKDLLVSDDGVLGSKDDDEHIDVKDIIKCVIAFDKVQDEGPDVGNKDKGRPLGVKDDLLDIGDKIQEIDSSGDWGKCVNSDDCISTGLDDKFHEVDVAGDREKALALVYHTNARFDDKIFEIDATIDREKCVDSVDCTNTSLDVKLQEVDATDDREKCLDSVDCSNTSLNAGVVSSQNVENDKLVDEIEQTVVESFSSVSPHNRSLYQCVDYDIKGMSPALLELPESLTENVLKNMVKSDQEAIKEAENSEEFPAEIEVKCSNHFNDNKASVDEMARDSIKISHEEILSDHSQESDCQIVTDLDEPQPVKFTSEVEPDSIFISGRPITPSTNLEALSHDCDSVLSLCILVIGKTGVGKSATVNSVFGEHKTTVNAFEPSTAHVKEINGEINGVKVKVFDTPGLRVSPVDQIFNRKILSSVKKITRKSPPDVVLYVERLDTQFTTSNDSPLLRLVTSCLGPSIWKKSVLAFTHADSPPPEGPDGSPLSYEEFVDQQSWAFQQLIGQSSFVALVENENHLSDEREKWRLNLMSLCCSVKILSELSSAVEADNPLNCLKMFSSPQILTRLVFEAYNDGDCGFPTANSVQFTKDKKRFDVKVRLSVSGQLMVSALAFLPIAKAVSWSFFARSAKD